MIYFCFVVIHIMNDNFIDYDKLPSMYKRVYNKIIYCHTDMLNLAAYDLEDGYVCYIIAFYYANIDLHTMVHYLLKAVEKNCVCAMYALANYYNRELVYSFAEKYWKMAAAHNHIKSMNCLSVYYFNCAQHYDNMKIYCNMAINSGSSDCIDSIITYASYYEHVEHNLTKRDEYFILATQYGSLNALDYLTNSYDIISLYKILYRVKNKNELILYKLELLEKNKEIQNYIELLMNAFYNNVISDCQECLTKNVLIVPLKCAHEICINCYNMPEKKKHKTCLVRNFSK